MFQQYNVHNCNKIDDMKNISGPCSCDLSFDEKARPRNFVALHNNRGFISRFQSKCKNNFLFRHYDDDENKQFDSNLYHLGSTSDHGWTYHSDNITEEKHNQQYSTGGGSYPRWFERSVRYLFSKQLRKCFDLA